MIKRYPIAFWLLNLSTLLFFFSFNVIIPEMPDYITSLGGEDYKGYIIGLFTIAAAISRPVSGKLTDKIGRLPIMYFGGLVCVVVSFFYPFFASVLGFLVLRLFHGLSTGFAPTGSLAYLADIVPKERRGEAMGIVGIMNNVGFMGGNACSSLISNAFGMDVLFYFSGVLALLSVAVYLRMKESLEAPERFKLNMLKFNFSDVYDKRAYEPAMVMVLTTMSFGAILTLIPDYSKALGVMNKGLFLSVTTAATILIRFWSGTLSDRIGRLRTSIIGTAFWIICTVLLMTLNKQAFFLAAVFMGFATGMNSPAIFAWAVDLANGIRSGRVMATLFISMEVGISIGAFLSAGIYDNQFERLFWVFLVLTVFNLLALVFLIVKDRAKSSAIQSVR